MSVIHFNYADVKSIKLTGKRMIKEQIAGLFLNEGKDIKQLHYIFCSDKFLLEINVTFLHHNFFTDVITFDLSEGSKIIGEVYISVDRVKENAIAYSTSYKNELLRVIVHGALHLCGYEDKKKSEITIMRRKEDYYLQLMLKKN